jgi:hypothetical protein
VIGIQECHCVEEVRAALHEHVGGPAAYHMFAAEVGASTILYGSIALTVLKLVKYGKIHLKKCVMQI